MNNEHIHLLNVLKIHLHALLTNIKVYLTDVVGEDDEEITFQIQVFITYEGDEYHDYYFCRYNKVYDFYSVYAYHE